jgi:O-Antigen ligase
MLLSLLAAMALGVALVLFVYVALRHSVATVAVVLAVWIGSVALRDTIDLSFTVSDIRLFALDLIAAVLALIGVARILRRGSWGLTEGLVLALLVLLLIHVGRGVLEFGIEPGLNASRRWIYFAAALVYASSVPGGWDRRVWQVVSAAGILLAAIAVPYFLVEGLSSSSDVVVRDGTLMRTTPVVGAGGLLILQAMIIAPAIGGPSRQAAIYVAAAAGAVVLLLQHRTLWATGIIVALVAIAGWVSRRERIERTTLIASAGVAAIVLPLLVWAFLQTESLKESTAEATTSESTFTWRAEGWDQLLSSHDSPSQFGFGSPSGEDWSRTLNGVVVNASAHNEFVEAYLRFGLPGALVLCAIGVLIWFRREEVGPACELPAYAVALLLLTQFLYGMTFELDASQGVIAGVFVSGLAASAHAAERVASRTPRLISRRLPAPDSDAPEPAANGR